MSNLNLKYRSKYGIDFPIEVPDPFIELVIAKHWRERKFKNRSGDDPAVHMCRGIRGLCTEKEFGFHNWSERIIYAWTHYADFLLVGSAASGKSNVIGACCVFDWVTDPTETAIIMASTGKDALRKRSYESVQRYHRILKKHPKFYVPGIEAKSFMAIINENDDEIKGDLKASIQGVAVADGTDQEARAKLQGSHLPYMRLVADELSQMKQAVLDVIPNMRASAIHSLFCGMCNPDGTHDMAMRNYSPRGGWGSINLATDEWTTRNGATVLRFDGRRSPAVLEKDGPEKYPYLIKQADIDANLARVNGNWDDPLIYTFVYGFPPMEGTQQTVLTSREVNAFNMQGPVKWRNTPTRVAGLDPAFSSGGDGCILKLGYAGVSEDTGLITICFDESIKLRIEISNPRPIIYQISDQTLDILDKQGIKLQHLGVDDTGTQSAADVIETEYFQRTGVRRNVLRIQFGGATSDRNCSMVDDTPAKSKYRNRVTELWYTLAEFGKNNQIRGLDDRAVGQFTRRRLAKKRPLQLDDKESARKYLQESPDDADACVCLVAVVRDRLGIDPGASEPSLGVTTIGQANNAFMQEAALSMNTEDSGYENDDYGLDNEGLYM